MGEGGMDPVYFSRALTFREAALYLAGLDRRHRAGWEQARMIAYYAAMPHVKDFSRSALPHFPWEQEEIEPDTRTDEERESELAALRAFAAQRDKELLTKMMNG